MASRSLNKVQLIGNLTRDPELRYTPSGTPVCTFGLATNRSWMPADSDQRQEETEFHRIVAWQKLAELCSQLLFKGRKVYVEGRIQTRSWTTQAGEERQATEIVIENMIVLDSRRREEGSEMAAPSQPTAPVSKPTADDSGKKKKVVKKVKAVKEEKKEEKLNDEKSASAQATADKEEVNADDIPF